MREALLDVNVLHRHLTGQPKHFAERVADLLEAADNRGVTLVVAPLTLAEVVHVLETTYRWQRAAIAKGLLDLVSASVLVCLEQHTVLQALVWYRDTAGLDFVDAYVTALAAERGHGTVISFDRHLGQVPEITVVYEAGQLRHG